MKELLALVVLCIGCIACMWDKDVKRSSFASGFIGFVLMCDIIAIIISIITLIIK